jgi:hypothetical protein
MDLITRGAVFDKVVYKVVTKEARASNDQDCFQICVVFYGMKLNCRM